MDIRIVGPRGHDLGICTQCVGHEGSCYAVCIKGTEPYSNVLTNADRSSVGAAQMISGVQSVTDLAIPAMRTALNQSILIIERLEALASHPVLQLSLK